MEPVRLFMVTKGPGTVGIFLSVIGMEILSGNMTKKRQKENLRFMICILLNI